MTSGDTMVTMTHHKSYHARARYTSLEISEELARRQLENVVSGGGHTAAYSVRRGDACATSDWGPPSRDFTYVLMCEARQRLLVMPC